MSRRVLLVAHTGRADVAAVAHKVEAELAAAGIVLVGLTEESVELALPALQDSGSAEVELVLSLGGDGTLLRAAEAARPLDVPVLGVNLGRVGFLAEADLDSLGEAVDAIVHRRWAQPSGVTVRMTVDVTIEMDGDVLEHCWALNEASVEKASRERILDVVVEVDGRGVSAFGCDGVLCATPTGSTAYAFSAGGPIIWPEVEALLVIPSNAHALFGRSMVVAPESSVTVHLDPEGHGAIVACDGRRIHEVPRGARVVVRRGERPVRMVRLGDQPFSDRLVRKFALPVHGWRDQRH
jgi:NAD+ kinase